MIRCRNIIRCYVTAFWLLRVSAYIVKNPYSDPGPGRPQLDRSRSVVATDQFVGGGDRAYREGDPLVPAQEAFPSEKLDRGEVPWEVIRHPIFRTDFSYGHSFLKDFNRNTRSALASPKHIYRHHHKMRIQLYSSSSQSLMQLFPNGTVGLTKEYDDPNTIFHIQPVRMTPYTTVYRTISTGIYLCMDRKGRLYSSCNLSAECEFLSQMEKTYYTTLESRRYSGRYIAVSRSGKIRRSKKPKNFVVFNDNYFLEIKLDLRVTRKMVEKAALTNSHVMFQHCAAYTNPFNINDSTKTTSVIKGSPGFVPLATSPSSGSSAKVTPPVDETKKIRSKHRRKKQFGSKRRKIKKRRCYSKKCKRNRRRRKNKSRKNKLNRRNPHVERKRSKNKAVKSKPLSNVILNSERMADKNVNTSYTANDIHPQNKIRLSNKNNIKPARGTATRTKPVNNLKRNFNKIATKRKKTVRRTFVARNSLSPLPQPVGPRRPNTPRRSKPPPFRGAPSPTLHKVRHGHKRHGPRRRRMRGRKRTFSNTKSHL